MDICIWCFIGHVSDVPDVRSGYVGRWRNNMEIGWIIVLVILAAMAGGTFGVFVMCLMVAASRADDDLGRR